MAFLTEGFIWKSSIEAPEFFMDSMETYKVNLNSGLNYKAKGCIANNANTEACNH